MTNTLTEADKKLAKLKLVRGRNDLGSVTSECYIHSESELAAAQQQILEQQAVIGPLLITAFNAGTNYYRTHSPMAS
ncbi:MAG: hypothetical protein WC810_28185, partial [Janthinobacterium sp.]